MFSTSSFYGKCLNKTANIPDDNPGRNTPEVSDAQSEIDDPQYQPETSDDDSTKSESTEDESPSPSTSGNQSGQSESSSGGQPSVSRIRWKKKVKATKEIPFPHEYGAVEDNFVGCSTATDFFFTLFDKEILDSLVFQTNLYATQMGNVFPPLTNNEFLGFIGLNFFMGYHIVPSYTHYWSSQSNLGIPLVQKTMSRNRFSAILQNVHVNDNNGYKEGDKDKLYKLRPLIQSLNETYRKHYKPAQEQSIDESMILFKGRISFKQYNPMKPIKRGYKIWCRCEPNGYVDCFDIYQGKDETSYKGKEYGLGGNVVMNLSSDILGKGHVLYFDNYFSSIPLLETLKKYNTFACATIRSTKKKFPVMKNDKLMKRGDVDWRANDDDIFCYKWKDNKTVHMISSAHGTELSAVKRRDRKIGGQKIDVTCPVVIQEYNKYMGGVDHCDMLRALYGHNRKSLKWWHRLFFGMLDMTLINSYVIYCELLEKIPLLEFVRSVTLGLLAIGQDVKLKSRQLLVNRIHSPSTSSCVKRRKHNYSVTEDVRLAKRGVHWPIFVQKRGRCEVCSKNGKESRPFSKCTTCDIYLCCNTNNNCFVNYHEVDP